MNPIVKKKWLEKLRGSEYEKGIGQLKTSDEEFCCLGVLCDINSKETGIQWLKCGETFRYQSSSSVLAWNVMDWAGLNSCNPKIDDTELSLLNDQENLNFDQIADLIEYFL